MSQGLHGVRQAAKARKQERFTSLLHHLSVGLLRDGFFALKRQAAPGVDGVRWQEYEAGLEDRLVDLYSRVHCGVYRAQRGCGFIIEYRIEYPPSQGKRCVVNHRIVVTAAHCLPYFPSCLGASHLQERTYKTLLRRLKTRKPEVWAECLFADPIGDIAVLGSPDNQELSDRAEACDAMTEKFSALRVATAPQSGRASLLHVRSIK